MIKKLKIEGEKMNNIVKSKWYEVLAEDCKYIITEDFFPSRWALVEGYWNLGKRIREDLNFQKYSKGNKRFATGCTTFKAV